MTDTTMAALNNSPRIKADRAQYEIGSDSDPMMVLNWYHPHLTRHAADCMLLESAPEGCYLLRPSSEKMGDYVLSVKLSSSVQHVKVTKSLSNSGGYKFGNCSFQNLESFRRHCEVEKPVIGGDSGITVLLRFPFSRYIDDTHQYTDVVHHAVSNMVDSESESEHDSESVESIKEGIFVDVETGKQINLAQTLAVSSREGYLTKQGRIRKSWRVRWFVLRSRTLTYYKTKQSKTPIRSLDLSQATAVEYDDSKKKDFCFRIDFPSRSLFIYANSIEDCQQWVELLKPLVRTS